MPCSGVGEAGTFSQPLRVDLEAPSLVGPFNLAATRFSPSGETPGAEQERRCPPRYLASAGDPDNANFFSFLLVFVAKGTSQACFHFRIFRLPEEHLKAIQDYVSTQLALDAEFVKTGSSSLPHLKKLTVFLCKEVYG